MLNLLVVLAGLVVLIASGIFGIFFPLSRGATVGGVRQVPPPKVHIVRGLVGGAIGGIIMIIGFAGPLVEVPAGDVRLVAEIWQGHTVAAGTGVPPLVPIYQRVTH